MYYKCTWCKARINFQPLYFTQGFQQLQPGFEVYCNAVCSLSAYRTDSKYDVTNLKGPQFSDRQKK